MSSTTHLMTAEELILLPRGQYRYELVKGELLTMSPSGGQHGAVTVYLTVPLATFVKANKLGVVFGAETGFILERNPDTVLAPDISFIRKDRIESISTGYLEIPPDLAVEVISPSEGKPRVEKKTAQWLEFGTRTVWLVYAKTRTVEVIDSSGRKLLLTERDELTCGDVLSGFRISVKDIFS
jgi:Uma2 family endonuclease